jgi:phosphoserine phosphatase RsbX
MNIAFATRPFMGETLCGDACNWWQNGNRILLAVADGLGHGPDASHASQTALSCIADHSFTTPIEHLFEYCNEVLRPTRGAALAIAVIDLAIQQFSVGCVGNIRVQWLHHHHLYRLDGSRGIVGGGYERLTLETHTLSVGDRLILFSDGISDIIPSSEFFNHAELSAQCQAEMLIERWSRHDDDACALVYRHC